MVNVGKYTITTLSVWASEVPFVRSIYRNQWGQSFLVVVFAPSLHNVTKQQKTMAIADDWQLVAFSCKGYNNQKRIYHHITKNNIWICRHCALFGSIFQLLYLPFFLWGEGSISSFGMFWPPPYFIRVSWTQVSIGRPDEKQKQTRIEIS